MDTAELDRIAYLTIQSAIEIHKKLGPGLLENVYRPCMIYELRARKLEVTPELRVPVRYKDLVVGTANFLRIARQETVNQGFTLRLCASASRGPVKSVGTKKGVKSFRPSPLCRTRSG
jgi:hypothetical protein